MVRTQARTPSRLRRWLEPMLSVICVVFGVTLITRPFQSLAVLILLAAAGAILTGLSDLADDSEETNSTTTKPIAVAWIMFGIVILLWPGLSLRMLTIFVGLALIVTGIARALSALSAKTDLRLAALLLGVASIILGIVALGWPDITLLVVAVVFGMRMVLFGLARLFALFRGTQTDASTSASGSRSRILGFAKTVGAALALLIALALATLSVWLHAGSPTVDAFYQPPDQVPPQHGMLLRAETLTRAIPNEAQAWRILYTTTRAEGVPALASAIVVAAKEFPAGPRPVIAWAHGTTGVAENCAPSLLNDPFAAGATPALSQVINNGWVLVATDYIGLGTQGPHAYLVGSQAGRAVLDAVRAARQMPELRLADQTVVWGHSQGGGAALWTGILAPSYAPDTSVVGVAALAPASDLPGLVDNLDVVKGGALFASYVIQGYSDTYADVRFDDYVRPTARILVREMASRCLAEPEVFASIVESLVIDKSIWSVRPSNGAFGARLKENVPSGVIAAPLLIAQGLGDELVLPTAQAAYVKSRCQAGGQVEYRTYEGFDHVGVVGEQSPLIPELLRWTQDRFDGAPATSTC